jgi:hypothetical protein
MMEYSDVTQILNRYVFEGQKRDLIEKLAISPERYVGIFRPTKPIAKLTQNLLQSHEIRFGDALEFLIKEIISNLGYSNLPRELKAVDGKMLSLDQFFTDEKKFYFVEQKIRDDHDSSKKRGQVQNFEAKLEFLYKEYQNKLVGMMFFIDPEFSKNKNYYMKELDRLKRSYDSELYLFYGHEFFDYLGKPGVWRELVGWIERWKSDLKEFPDMNFDLDPNFSFEEIKVIDPIYWRKLLDSDRIWKDGIIRALFANGDTLKLLFGYFSQQQTQVYSQISKTLLERINEYYY